MSATTTTFTANPLRDIVVRRQLDAPLAVVWRAFTDGPEVMKWWGPEGFTAPSARMDVREGGTSVVCMRSPDHQDFYSAWHIITFQSSSAGTELVVTERGYDAGPFYDLSKAGLEQCLDKLERALKARDR